MGESSIKSNLCIFDCFLAVVNYKQFSMMNDVSYFLNFMSYIQNESSVSSGNKLVIFEWSFIKMNGIINLICSSDGLMWY
jgi:hypothetical protein